MTRLPRAILAVLAVVAGPAAAQQPAKPPAMNMPGMDKPAATSSSPYQPGLGELMTAFVQPRHIKLGLAGAAGNWAYAAYELDELQETFGDVAKLVPMHGNLSVPQAIDATVKAPIAALDAAIKAANHAAFAKAYGELTAGCNACHQSAGHPMIVIRVPTGSPFPDQVFAPQK